MPKASVKRLIECNKNQLIDLVLDIEKYPEFVPFCLDAYVYENNNKGDLVLIIACLMAFFAVSGALFHQGYLRLPKIRKND